MRTLHLQRFGFEARRSNDQQRMRHSYALSDRSRMAILGSWFAFLVAAVSLITWGK